MKSKFRQPAVGRTAAKVLGGLLVSASLGAAGVAWAQTAGHLAQPSAAPPPMQPLAGSVVFSGASGLSAPAGADRLWVTIRSVTVDGTLPGMQGATDRLEARLTGQRIPVSQIFSAANDLERAYADAGYVLARVVLPAQTLTDGGSLRLVIVNGFVESIDTKAVPEKLRRRMDQVLQPLLDRPGITQQQIERQLLIAGDTYGVALGSALAAGATPGGTVIILQPKFQSVTGFVGFDNSFSEELGTYNLTGGVEFNGYLGLGESIYLRASGNPTLGDNSWFGSDPRLRTLAAGAVFPIGPNGLTFNIEGTSSQTNPDTLIDQPSLYQRLSFRVFYPWMRTRTLNVSGQVSLDLVKDDLDLETAAGKIPLHRDQISVLRFSADTLYNTPGGAIIEAGAIASFGLDAFGARTAPDDPDGIPLSRFGAQPDFQKLEVSARYRKIFAPKLAFSLAGRAQTSFGEPLVSSEQIGIATMQELSAFDQGTIWGDSGWVVRAEVSSPREFNSAIGAIQARPYLFGAVGDVYLDAPSLDEVASERATSFGIGVELLRIRDPRFSSASLTLELARGTREDGDDNTRFNVVGSYRF